MGPAPMRNDGSTTGTKADEFRRIEVITGVGRRRRWTDEEKAWIVADSLDPATTVSAVARHYGLHASQLFTWRQRLAAPAAREGPALVPVLVAEDGPAPAAMPGGWRSRSARPSSASVRMSTRQHCARCSRWCGAWRDRGPAGSAHPLGGAAGRLPQRHGRTGGAGAAGAPRRPVRRRRLHLPP